MRHAHALLAAALFAPVLAGAAPPEATRRFALGGFDAVTLTGADRVVVAAGPAAAVVATGEPDALASLRIEVKGGTLRIGRQPGSYRDHGATVTVTTPRLARVTLDGSGSIRVGGITGPRFAATANGSGGITVDGLRVAETRLGLSGSGSIVVAGTTPQLWVDAAGSGTIDATRAAVDDIDVTSSGSSSIRARASRRAVIRSTGSGSVTVDGARDCRVTRTGSGVAHCRPAA